MAEIIPAIMPNNIKDLEDKVNKILSVVDVVQVDVMDGKFVKNKTWPYIKQDVFFEDIIKQDKGLPFWEDIDYEIDMMIANPLEESANWIQAGAKRLIGHIESFNNEEDVNKFIDLKNEFLEIGLAIGIDTPLDKIEKYLDKVSFVQFMGINHIGYQKQPFDNKVFDKIKEIRNKNKDVVLSIDGGVSLQNVEELVNSGIDRLVSGSLIFETENPI
jgi:ribulose-phosphate 3-epimerase